MLWKTLEHMTQHDWLLLAVGLICIGPLAVNLGYFLWWRMIQPDKHVRLREALYQNRCPECGHVERERIPFCPRCGAFVQFTSRV